MKKQKTIKLYLDIHETITLDNQMQGLAAFAEPYMKSSDAKRYEVSVTIPLPACEQFETEKIRATVEGVEE